MRPPIHILAAIQSWDDRDPVAGSSVSIMNALAPHADLLSVVALRSNPATLPLHPHTRIYPLASLGPLRCFLSWHQAVRAAFSRAPVTAAFTHMSPTLSALLAPYAVSRGVPIATWFTHFRRSPFLFLAESVSSAIITAHPSSYPGSPDRAVSIGHGIDTHLFSPGSSPVASSPLILSVGRIARVKRHDVLIRALAALYKAGVSYQAEFVGIPVTAADMAYFRMLRSMVADAGLSDRIRFVSGVPRAHLPDRYRSAAVSINLSPSGSFDKAVLESLACGTPVIVSNDLFLSLMGSHAPSLFASDLRPAPLAALISGILSLPLQNRTELSSCLRAAVVRDHGLSGFARRLSRAIISA